MVDKQGYTPKSHSIEIDVALYLGFEPRVTIPFALKVRILQLIQSTLADCLQNLTAPFVTPNSQATEPLPATFFEQLDSVWCQIDT